MLGDGPREMKPLSNWQSYGSKDWLQDIYQTHSVEARVYAGFRSTLVLDWIKVAN